MNGKNAPLLPSGLYDLLPPEARKESQAALRLLSCFESFGYAQVSPPLMEFEASLLSGRGEALGAQSFRVADTMSQAMMAVRPDITLQAARIAGTRLASSPRPLRLCYAGPILQSRPEPLRSERQLTQAGIELIGAEGLPADAEVMIVAAEALTLLGLQGISIDINLPGLLWRLCPEARDSIALQTQIRDAVTRRDAATFTALPLKNNKLIVQLLAAAGPAEKALAAMKKLDIPEAQALTEVIARVGKHCPGVALTLDPIEYRGFEYHEGISFSIFAGGLRHELGRGGRYDAEGETATGFTLYVTYLLRLLPVPPEPKRILVPHEENSEKARQLRGEGWATLQAVTNDMNKEAARLGCTHILKKGKTEKI